MVIILENKKKKDFKKEPKEYKEPKKQVKKQERKKAVFDFKLFGKYDSNVPVKDISLKPYINLQPKFLPRSAGIHRGRFHKSDMYIVERLALDLLVPGHTGKKHRLTSGKFGGNYSNTLSIVEKTLDLIHKKENKNPVEVLVGAIENAAVREEIISFQMGSIMAREAVICAPQRRVDKTIKFFAQGAYRKAFNKKKAIEDALSEELIAAYKSSQDSAAIKEKERVEREASGAR